MTSEHMMINRLLELAKSLDGEPPTVRLSLDVSAGDISMLAKGLELLAAVRAAAKV